MFGGNLSIVCLINIKSVRLRSALTTWTTKFTIIGQVPGKKVVLNFLGNNH